MVVFVNLLELIGLGIGLLWAAFVIGFAIKINWDNRRRSTNG